MRLNAKQIAQYCAATVRVEAMDPSRIATGITWDSREVKPGDVYVAFPGERVDGHSFVKDSLHAGAIVILVMQPLDESLYTLAREMGAAVLEVGSTFSALTDLAREWRKHLKARVIALTGSTGKTTTKNLVRDVLGTTYRTIATKGNQNNELGVPKTILEANPDTEYVVVEMGMRGSGQLRELCEFVKPDLALITNTGECHIELLGSREAIAAAKAEVVEALPSLNGKAILNACDERTALVKKVAFVEERSIEVVGFDGSGNPAPDARVYATEVILDEQGRPRFELHTPEGTRSCALGLRGLHNVHNACSAAAIGYVCGVSLDNTIAGLEASLPEVGRQEVLQTRTGVTVINDAYNANPDSMRASLAMFTSMNVLGKRYAVLGDMGELGSYAQVCHEGIGAQIATMDIDFLICIGSLAAHIARAAEEQGYPRERIYATMSRGEAIAELEVRLQSGDAVLVKASHSMELERIVKGLLN